MDLRPLHKRASFPVPVGKAHGPRAPTKATQKTLGSYLFYFTHFCGQEECLASSLIQHFCFKRHWPACVLHFHRNSSLFFLLHQFWSLKTSAPILDSLEWWWICLNNHSGASQFVQVNMFVLLINSY